MNILLSAARLSLEELKLGLEGALNISDAMEAMGNALALNRVPAGWAKWAYASLKPLGDWFINMVQRVDQLVDWTENMRTPKTLWLSGLFNPMAFVTAVMQVTSRKETIPLDNITTKTDVTQVTDPAEIEGQPEDGA